jgi:hypothetical protein
LLHLPKVIGSRSPALNKSYSELQATLEASEKIHMDLSFILKFGKNKELLGKARCVHLDVYILMYHVLALLLGV